MLPNYHSFQPRPNRRSVRELQHHALPTNRRKGPPHRGMLLPKEGWLNSLINSKKRIILPKIWQLQPMRVPIGMPGGFLCLSFIRRMNKLFTTRRHYTFQSLCYRWANFQNNNTTDWDCIQSGFFHFVALHRPVANFCSGRCPSVSTFRVIVYCLHIGCL